MYIWIGCLLPKEFESDVRSRCIPIAQEFGLDSRGFSLPQHISLKISFDASDRYEEILDFLQTLLQNEPQFYVNPKPVERQGNILWIPFRESGQLQHLHNMLDKQLKLRYGIAQHLFDKAFQFHSTLLIGPEATLSEAAAQLQDLPIPSQLKIDTIALGISETGKSGDYRVVRELHL